jgi:hypothetical protein
MRHIHRVADGVWTMRYPLGVLGCKFGRTVTVMQLASGKLLVHSTAAFETDDVSAIRSFGTPAWLIDATLFHDSFAKEGRAAFPDLDYLAPHGFAKVSGVSTTALRPAPDEWASEVDVLQIGGAPKVNEHVFLHRASRTLVVCDLLFNLATASPWTRFFGRHVMRLRTDVGMSAFFRMMIRDRKAFRQSVEEILRWDFARIVVGHGEVIQREPKARVAELLERVKP